MSVINTLAYRHYEREKLTVTMIYLHLTPIVTLVLSILVYKFLVQMHNFLSRSCNCCLLTKLGKKEQEVT